MGLIKAAAAAVGSTLHDQWKEYIRCDDLGQDILMKRVSTPNGVISKDSAIQVAPGQIAVVFQNGQILDATAEERANRRFKQNQEKGIDMSYEEVLDNIKKRDKNDMEKEMGALKVAPGATVIDGSNMTIKQVEKNISKI